jgi:hypothetical protein
VPERDRRIEFTGIEGLEHRPRGIDVQTDHEARIGGVDALEHRGQFGADDVVADADGQAAMLDREGADRGLMRGDQMARGAEKRAALRRQPDLPRGSLQKAPAETVFQPLDLQADRRLRGVQRLRGPGKTVQIGHQHKGLHRLDVERSHHHSFQYEIIEIVFHVVF